MSRRRSPWLIRRRLWGASWEPTAGELWLWWLCGAVIFFVLLFFIFR